MAPCGHRPGDSVDGLPSFDGKESGVPPPARGGTAGSVLSKARLLIDSFQRALIHCTPNSVHELEPRLSLPLALWPFPVGWRTPFQLNSGPLFAAVFSLGPGDDGY